MSLDYLPPRSSSDLRPLDLAVTGRSEPTLPSPMEPSLEKSTHLGQRHNTLSPAMGSKPNRTKLPGISSLFNSDSAHSSYSSASIKPHFSHPQPAVLTPPISEHSPGDALTSHRDSFSSARPGVLSRNHSTDGSVPFSHNPRFDSISRLDPSLSRTYGPDHVHQRAYTSAAPLPGPLSRASPQVVSARQSPSPYHPDYSREAVTGEKRRADGITRPQGTGAKVLGEQVINGQHVYSYSDGSHVPTVIDGEKVNPLWGMTKAGKPRKRLAKACLTCREKKIKCDPGPDGPCNQCQKAQRECRSDPNDAKHPSPSVDSSRGQTRSPRHRTPGTTHSSPTYGPGEHGYSYLEGERPAQRRRISSDTLAPTTSHGPSPPRYHERRPEYRPEYANASYPPPDVYHERQPLAGRGVLTFDLQQLQLDSNLFEIAPELARQLVESFFENVNSTVYCMFPREDFSRWLQGTPNGPRKTGRELMVVNGVLALGARYSPFEEIRVAGHRLHSLSMDLLHHERKSISFEHCHASLLASLYCFLCHEEEEACRIMLQASICIKQLRDRQRASGVQSNDLNLKELIDLDESIHKSSDWASKLLHGQLKSGP